MQFITLDQLKQLASSSAQVDESWFNNSGKIEISPGFKFQDVCEAYDARLQKEKEYFDANDAKKWLRLRVYEYMNNDVLSKHCPPIELVGKGSSRTAYACIGGKCLKVAYSDAGVAQNKQEYKTTAKGMFKKTYECFAQSYGSNGSDYGVLLTECCAKADADVLAVAFGVSSFDVIRAIMVEVSALKSSDAKTAETSLSKKAAEYKQHGKGFDTMLKWAKVADEAAEFLHSMQHTQLSQMLPGQRTIATVFDFWHRNGLETLMPGDIGVPDNWGFAIRNGDVAPVVLDAGFSKQIARKYY